ncbi:hypothetical protein ACQZV8_16160 [Magnetococcales bacterium HHB-1]
MLFFNKKLADRSDEPFIGKDRVGTSRIFASTVVRNSPASDPTGYLIEVDWVSGKVIKKEPIPLDTNHPFWNPRGGHRGGRGIAYRKGILYVATDMSILKYNSDLEIIGEINQPYFAGLHELFIDDQGIWVTSTVHDLVMKVDFEGEILDLWWGSKSPILQKELGFTERELNLELNFPGVSLEEGFGRYCREERLHVNTVWQEGEEVFIFASKQNALVRIRPGPDKVIVHDKALKNSHNGIIDVDGNIIINNTQMQQVFFYSYPEGQFLRKIDTRISGNRGSEQFAKAGWQRGLVHWQDGVYLVGSSPACIFEVDIRKNKVGKLVEIDSDVNHCVHGLIVVDNFA